MSPRPYQLGRRQDQIDESRRRVIDAARSLLAQAGSYRAFTVDAVAKKADVSKATIYYQFESKTGLLEAVCDTLAETGGMSELPSAFADPDPANSLRTFVAIFGHFWNADRTAMRRLRALAALDPEVAQVISARDARRRAGLEVLVSRMVEGGDESASHNLVRAFYVLTSFETFDALAEPGEPLTDVVDNVILLADAVRGRIDPTKETLRSKASDKGVRGASPP